MSDTRPRYDHFFRCKTCGGRFSVRRLTADPDKVKTPPCPRKRCGGKVKPSHMPDVGMDVAAGRFPSTPSVMTQAMDMAMEVGAYNSGLTNLNDRPYVGEHTAPKLPGNLQAMADNFFPDRSRLNKNQRTGRVNLSNILGPQAQAPRQAQPAVRVSADVGLGPIHAAGESGRPKTVYLDEPRGAR